MVWETTNDLHVINKPWYLLLRSRSQWSAKLEGRRSCNSGWKMAVATSPTNSTHKFMNQLRACHALNTEAMNQLQACEQCVNWNASTRHSQQWTKLSVIQSQWFRIQRGVRALSWYFLEPWLFYFTALLRLFCSQRFGGSNTQSVYLRDTQNVRILIKKISV
jgi:hypothetical protein